MRFAVIALLSLFASVAQADIARLHHVAAGIYRGAQPETAADYRELQDLGVRTIINLRLTPWEVIAEHERAASLGMRFIHHPYSPIEIPDDWRVSATLR